MLDDKKTESPKEVEFVDVFSTIDYDYVQLLSFSFNFFLITFHALIS